MPMKKIIAFAAAPFALFILACGASPSSGRVDTPVAEASAPVASAPLSAPAKAGPTIQADTLVHVGEDVPAGTYRANADAKTLGSMCYWSKSTDSEGTNIIANDIVKGGRSQVTLAKGQWFTSQGCGQWAKK